MFFAFTDMVLAVKRFDPPIAISFFPAASREETCIPPAPPTEAATLKTSTVTSVVSSTSTLMEPLAVKVLLFPMFIFALPPLSTKPKAPLPAAVPLIPPW